MVLGTLFFLKTYKTIWGEIKWISPSILIIFSYIIVHFQMFFYLVLGLEFKNYFFDFIWASETVINKSASISIIGLLSFQLAYLKSNKIPVFIQKSSNFVDFYLKKKSSVFLIFFTYLFYILFFLSDSAYRNGSYIKEGGISDYFFLLFNVFLTACISIKLFHFNYVFLKVTKTGYLYKLGLPIMFISAWHILFSLYIGDRGPAISYSILISSIFLFKYYHIGFKKFFIIVLVGSFALTLIGQARRLQNNGNMFDKLSSASKNDDSGSKFDGQNVPLLQTLELALSIRCLNHAIYNVPNNFNYGFGYYQILQTVSTVPAGGRVFMQLMNKDENYKGTPNFISYLIQGDKPIYGDGTTPAADFYLDFGLIGVMIGLYLFGFFVKKGENAMFYGTNSMLLWISIIVYFSFSIFSGRAPVLFHLKIIFLSYLIIYINYFFSNLKLHAK
jgi:hypothetical protein